ncbi:CoA transferase [Belnapia sp. T6]|uniref:CoA transferase n=1 Tax=Belnapia mucosa TaxID=2804532 RepID=A0ABS1V958_9PROT|nr:CoA transferase [Belnapia mucosa]MBL6457279.1 CoA transferase [Belnapia mucosa]
MIAPLAGLRVLDLSHVLAGPYAAYHLGLLGAEVIKIERPPFGDAIRDLETRPQEGGVTAAFQGVNAGKRALALDLTRPEGRAVLERLIPTAAVFLENFRPGKMAGLGFGPERVAALNPAIVYASVSAWGQQGSHAGRPGYDHVMQAATGMMWLQGDDPAAAPMKVGFPAIDMAAGMMGAMAIMAGLMRRRAGDTGPIVLDVSMADAALALMSAPAARYLMEGAAPARIGNGAFAASPGGNVFRTADGWLATAANTLGQFEALVGLLGHPDWATAPDWLRLRPSSPAAMLRDCGTPRLEAALRDAFLAHGSEEWEARLSAAGVPAAAVRSPAAFLDGPYRATPGFSTRLPGGQEVLGAGFRINGQAPVPSADAPRLGADTDVVLAELGYADAEIAALRAGGVVR